MKPAILGGPAAFPRPLSFTRPALPPYPEVSRPLAEVFRSGILTKGHYLEAFEAEVAAYLGVKYAIAVSSGTTGLVLVFQALGLKGEAIIPSYTFMATVHPLLWIGVKPVFVDVDPESWNIKPDAVRRAITSESSAIVAVHTFGNPADVKELEAVAREHHLKLIFDAAHGFGSLHDNRPLGSHGAAEVFSTSPTKLLVTGEGGVVTTNDEELAERVRVGREYGNPGNYNSLFPGLNGRMQEFSALLGLEGLKFLEGVATSRNEVAALYKESLSRIPGLTFQCINPSGRCSYKDFTVLVDEALFGVSRDGLASALRAEGIDTRNYYDPPVHLHETYKAFRTASDGRLPATERISKSCLSLPIGSHLHREDVVKIASAIERIHGHTEQIMERYVRERKGRKQMR